MQSSNGRSGGVLRDNHLLHTNVLTQRMRALLAGLLLTTGVVVQAQVPTMISYQSRVLMNDTNFNGTGQFRFALINASGTVTYWANSIDANVDGRPDNAVALPVVNGLVTTLLGNPVLPNMLPIPTTVFENSGVFLRVWFDGGAGVQQLSPDQRIVSVGYAMMAASVLNGSLTTAKFAPGVLHPTNFPANSVSSTQLADDVDLGTPNLTGRLDVFRTAAATPSISLFGNASQISTFGSDGFEQTRLWGTDYGELLLNNSLANNATAVRLTAQGATGGQLELRNTNGSNRAVLEGENVGGTLTLYQGDGNIGAVLYGNDAGAGAISLRNTNGSARLRAYGGPASGRLELYDNDGTQTILAEATEGTEGSQILMRQANGATTVQLDAESGSGGGAYFSLYNAAGIQTLVAQADEVVGDGAQLILRNAAGASTIVLDANQGTEPRITVAGTVSGRVVEITGGADLSEKFHVGGDPTQITPGMLVCIDPDKPGHLIPSRAAYDRTAAGVVSGAGGVSPGMLMSHAGTLADGKYPVALTGRVYALVDASHGSVQPGDLITTSDTPGHGMKVMDHQRAQGAIVGKAMTALKSGRGLVLVLVCLQ